MTTNQGQSVLLSGCDILHYIINALALLHPLIVPHSNTVAASLHLQPQRAPFRDHDNQGHDSLTSRDIWLNEGVDVNLQRTLHLPFMLFA